MQFNDGEPCEIDSDDEDENEARLSASLRWLISKAYPQNSIPDYLPRSHFFQSDNNERFLSPDIALVLLSGDLYIRAFAYITDQQDQIITLDDVLDCCCRTNDSDLIDSEALKQDEPLNASVHLLLIENLMELYARLILNQEIVFQRFEQLHIRSGLPSISNSTQLDTESLLIVWINGICEHMTKIWRRRIPPVIRLRTSLSEGTCLCALVAYYDSEYNSDSSDKTDLNRLRTYLNHHHTNLFPFTIRTLRNDHVPDMNLRAMLVDLFALYEKKVLESDEENNGTQKSNQTYSINGDEDGNSSGGINDFFATYSSKKDDNNLSNSGILQTSTNHDRPTITPMKSSLKTSQSVAGNGRNSVASKKSTSFMPTTTTWQRQAISNQTTPTRQQGLISNDDQQLNNEYLAVKMQLELKKRAIERDKQRLEQQRENKRQTISQEAFKQLLQQKSRTTAALANDSVPSRIHTHMRKSQTTAQLHPTSPAISKKEEESINPPPSSTSIVDLSKPMTRDDFLSTLELLKQKYLETTTPVIVKENHDDEGQRIDELNSNLGELQQVLTSLSEKQEELHNQVVGNSVSRKETFTSKHLTYPRRRPSSSSSSTPRESEPTTVPFKLIIPSTTTTALALDIVDDPSDSTALDMERKRELVLQRQQQRQEAFERRRQMREIENTKRDNERRRREDEELAKRNEREQRRDEIYRQYMMKKEKKPPLNGYEQIDIEHPTIKMRPKSSTVITSQRPTAEKRPTGPVLISGFGTTTNGTLAADLFDNGEETIAIPPPLSFVRMAEMRIGKTPSRTGPTQIDSRTLPRSSTRSTTEHVPPLMPIAEPRYPLAKPLSSKSNKQTIINALTKVVLAGLVNNRLREQVCEEIERYTDAKHFVLLFRDARLQFRGVYTLIPPSSSTNGSDIPAHLERLHGSGPREISNTMVETFYKYNNGSKQFSPVPIKSFSVQCDAITIQGTHWTQQSTAAKRAMTTTVPLPPSE